MKTLKQRESLKEELGLIPENEMEVDEMAYMKGRGVANAATGGDAANMCTADPNCNHTQMNQTMYAFV